MLLIMKGKIRTGKAKNAGNWSKTDIGKIIYEMKNKDGKRIPDAGIIL